MFQKGDKVRRITNDHCQAKKGEIYTVKSQDKYDLELQEIDGFFMRRKFEKVNKFRVGDKVKYSGTKAKIWGIAEEKDYNNDEYGITYFNEVIRDTINLVVAENDLKPIKSKDELEKEDKFVSDVNIEHTVIASAIEKGDRIYFTKGEDGITRLLYTGEIKEVL